ncbi:MAG: adenosylmethionine--8-amino-7-oxononanoate transaminase [Phycisphaerae bacterium]|nr:adenosylmethionine--8-amino-7-oxononanoate transaminase [Phycisphaerae bacterium]
MSWIERDLRTLWHPYTQMKDCETLPPILIERAQGLSLFDDQGHEYWDTISSWWCNIHGHNHPKIVEAITRQLATLDHVLFAGFSHKGAIELGERLVDITPPGLTRVFYSDNGSTAVEVALKMSLQYWRNMGRPEKCQFVGLDKGYHGDTVGAMSVSGASAFTQAFAPMLFETHKVPTPDCYHCPKGQCQETCTAACIAELETLLKERHDQIAALILEPLLMGAAGMIVYPAEYLQKAAKIAQQYGVHLILDEVATGFGRTGRMFACEHAEVSPDFMCLSKGLTSGTLPLAVTLTTDAVFDAFYDDYPTGKTLYHGHTYTANPIGCAAAMATLDIFEQEHTLASVQTKAPGFAHRMQGFGDLEHVGHVRTIGLVAAMELVRDKATKTPFDSKQRIGLEIFKQGLKQGLILRPMGDVVYLYLPLCVTDEQVTIILDKTYGILSRLGR